MRLIDADALHDELKAKQKWVVRRGEKHNEGYTYDQVHFAIDDAPTIEAEPVKQGHWIMEFENDDGRSLRCSNCLMVFWVGHGRDGNYCPNCGAKMDERKEE